MSRFVGRLFASQPPELVARPAAWPFPFERGAWAAHGRAWLNDGRLQSPLGLGLLTVATIAWFGPGWAPVAGFPALALAWWRRHTLTRTRGTGLDVPIAFLAAMGALALVPSRDLATSLGRLLGLVLGMCFFLVICDLLQTEKRLWIVVSWLAVSGVALSIVGLVGTAWPTDPALPAWVNGVYAALPRWITFLPRLPDGELNGNKLAAALAMLLPLPTAVMLYTPGRFLRLGWGLGAAVTLGTLLLTRSPSGILAAAAALVALAAMRSRRARLGLPLVAVACLVSTVWLGSARVAESLFGLSLAPGDTPLLGTRLALWSAAVDLIARFPVLGIGIGTFPEVLGRYAPWVGADRGIEVPHAHNLYLQFALDLGVPGLLALLLLVLATMRVAVGAIRLGPTARARGLAAGATSGLVAYLVYGLGDAIGPGEKPALFLWLLLGILAASGAMAELAPGPRRNWTDPPSGAHTPDDTSSVQSVIYLSSFEWTYHTARPQQLARALAAHVPVLYVETTGLRGAGPGDLRRLLRRLRRSLAGRYRVLPNVWVFSPLTLPFRGPSVLRNLNALLLRDAVRGQAGDLGLERPLLLTSLPTQASLDLLGHVGEVATMYDCMDDVTAIPRVDAHVAVTEAQLARVVDVMLAASEELRRLKLPLRHDIAVVGQGVDSEHFGALTACPPELAHLGHPRLLFVGGVDDRLDFSLLDRIAHMRPQWSIVLVGPELYVKGSERLRAPNVHRLGYRSYEVLPAYIQASDVCLVPYVESAWARACNPVKVLEYLAGGRMVVGTDLPALRTYGSRVRIASGPEAFLAEIEKALESDGPTLHHALRSRARGETWALRATAVLQLAGAAARRRQAPATARNGPSASKPRPVL